MIGWLRGQRHAALEALGHLVDRPFNTLVVTLLLGLGLALAATTGAITLSVSGWAPAGDTLRVTLVLRPGRPPAPDLLRSLEARPEVASVRGVAPRAALERAGTLLDDPAAVERLPAALVPGLVEVDLRPEAHGGPGPALPDWLLALGARDDVQEVVSEAVWREQVRSVTAFLGTGLAGLCAVLVLLVLLVLTGAVRTLVTQRARHVTLEGLLGCDTAQLRRPFVWLGFVLGFLGGCWASLLLLAIDATLQPAWNRVLGAYGLDPGAYGLLVGPGWALAGPPGGALLGALAALTQTFRVGRSRDRAADLDLGNLSEH